MKLPLQDTERVTVGLKEAITLLCKTGLNFDSELHIDGLLGITLDNDEVFLVKIKEVIRNPLDDLSDDYSADGEVIDLCVKDTAASEDKSSRAQSCDERWEERERSINDCMVIQPEFVAQGNKNLGNNNSNDVTNDSDSQIDKHSDVGGKQSPLVHDSLSDTQTMQDNLEIFHRNNLKENSIASDNSQGPAVLGFNDELSENGDSNSSGFPVNLSSNSSLKGASSQGMSQVKEEPLESQRLAANHSTNSTDSNNSQSNIPNYVPFNEQELRTKWLQNIAAHLQGSPEPVIPAAHTTKAPSSFAGGSHKYSPYGLPVTTSNKQRQHTLILPKQPAANLLLVPQGIKSERYWYPPLVVGGAKPPSSTSSQSRPTADIVKCSNCGSDKTTTWRRGPDGRLVCNPCGLYYRLYKSSLRRPSPSKQSQGGSHLCANCGTSVTTMWRRNAEGDPVCNACGLYFKLHKVNRPLSMAKTEIHSRRRKPKSGGLSHLMNVSLPGMEGMNTDSNYGESDSALDPASMNVSFPGMLDGGSLAALDSNYAGMDGSLDSKLAIQEVVKKVVNAGNESSGDGT